MSSPPEPTEGAPRPLIDTASAAEALNISEHQLQGWAQAGVVTAERVDPDGERCWDLHDLRRRIADYLDDHDGDEQAPTGYQSERDRRDHDEDPSRRPAPNGPRAGCTTSTPSTRLATARSHHRPGPRRRAQVGDTRVTTDQAHAVDARELLDMPGLIEDHDEDES